MADFVLRVPDHGSASHRFQPGQQIFAAAFGRMGIRTDLPGIDRRGSCGPHRFFVRLHRVRRRCAALDDAANSQPPGNPLLAFALIRRVCSD